MVPFVKFKQTVKHNFVKKYLHFLKFKHQSFQFCSLCMLLTIYVCVIIER